MTSKATYNELARTDAKLATAIKEYDKANRQYAKDWKKYEDAEHFAVWSKEDEDALNKRIEEDRRILASKRQIVRREYAAAVKRAQKAKKSC